MSGRCLGGCCETFWLPGTLVELQATPYRWQDGEYIAQMVYPKPPPADAIDRTGNWYGCTHWNAATRKCGDYANRPRMCRRFPYGVACWVEGCTYREDSIMPHLKRFPLHRRHWKHRRTRMAGK